MIAKITTGHSFSITINYVLDEKKNAELIGSDGVRTKDKQSIIDSFKMQQEMKSCVKKPVYHISLGFSVQDFDKLTNEFLNNVAQDYIQEMNFDNTQFVIVQHFDKEHPHLHLCINRIDNNGNLISNKNDWNKSEKICKELTEKYNLYFAPDKENVKRHRLKGADEAKYEIYDAISEILFGATNWIGFEEDLLGKNIQIKFKYKGKSNVVQGIIFEKNGYSFSGSKIDRKFSYSKLNSRFRENAIFQHNEIRQKPNQERSIERQTFIPFFPDVNTSRLNNDDEFNENLSRRKKKKKDIELSM